MISPERIVILGGGFAGLETAFLLRHRLRDRVDVTLVSDRPAFLFRPNTIYIPFGLDPDELTIPLSEPTGRQGIRFVHAAVRDVDPERRRVVLEGHEPLPYDRLVIATGAAMRPEEVPGLGEHANTIWTPAQMQQLGAELHRVVDRARGGASTRLLFLIPPNNKCAGPLYEMVFMVDTHLRREGVRDRVQLTWATSEASFIQAFGPRLHEVVTEEFAERGIEGHTGLAVEEVVPGEVRFAGGDRLGFDSLVAFPPYIAAVPYPALPGDDRGFLDTLFRTRQVEGYPNVYAPGDAGNFPVKQAFLAFLQADAVAEHIAGELTGHAPRAWFDPVSMCVMEQLDKAVFAQVPLTLTGDPAAPVAVRPDADGAYKVGVSPMWRLGKKLLGVYLPMRFRAGEPFHAGTAWTMMEVGLKGMSGVLAR
ncbi:MAG: FAD-dependent oxidoreductase [Rubricoccaceae bacterium]|nr:FAD-dependent oxidoreductase [Rubricoccaceae bacterium]